MLQERDYILRLIAMAGEMVPRGASSRRRPRTLELLEQAVQRLATPVPSSWQADPRGPRHLPGRRRTRHPDRPVAGRVDARFEALSALGRAAEAKLARSQAEALRAAAEHESDGKPDEDGCDEPAIHACKAEAPDRPRGTAAARAAAAFLEAHCEEDVPLERLAKETGVSPAHLQRTFTKVFGHSPRQHVAALRAEALKERLRAGEAVSDAGYQAGIGSSRGVYEASQRRLGMAPGTCGGGEGMSIRYATEPTRDGPRWWGPPPAGCAPSCSGIRRSSRGGDPRAENPTRRRRHGARARSRTTWPGRARCPTCRSTSPAPISSARSGRLSGGCRPGTRSTYADRRDIGAPDSYRAVANACGDNHIAVLVPCHRVLRERSGGSRRLQVGVERKRRLLEREAAAGTGRG